MDNFEEINEIIENYCDENKLDKYHFMVDIFSQISSSTFEIECEYLIETIVERIDLIEYEAEAQLLDIVVYLIDEIDRDTIFKNMSDKEIQSIMVFIDSKYYDSWKDAWDNNDDIGDSEYDECLTELYNSFDMDEDTADVFIGLYLDEKIKK